MGYILPLWRGIGLSVLLGLLTVASSVGLMATSAWMISMSALQPSIAALGVSVVAVRFFGIARGVFRYLERLVSHDTTFRLLAEWRVRFYKAIEPLAPARLMDARSGDLLGRVVSDIDALQEVYLRAIAPPLVALLTAIFVLALFGAFDPFVALVMLGFMILGGVGLPLLAWWAGQHPGRKLVAIRAELHASLVDEIQGMGDRLVYGQASEMSDLLSAGRSTLRNSAPKSDIFAAQERRIAVVDAVQTALNVLVVNGAALAVLVVAIGRVNGIYLATLALATVTAFEAFSPLAQAATNLGTGLAAAQRLFDIVDMPPAVVEPQAVSPVPQDYRIQFESVTFRYMPQSAPALHELSFDVQTGQRVAIVGSSGAGKSTIANLLLRFWEYESGSIRLGGHDLRDYTSTDLRRMIGVMSQRTYLFNTTVMENIRLARADASDEDVLRAAKLAQMHDFIAALPDGYATRVGEDGARLSGGERQRIALARVLLKDAPIVILDEPTANLDAVTEQSVWRSILETTTGRTLLVMTHRLPAGERWDQMVRL
jgi:ATP-binding cassette subfamily C protein CydC